MQIVMHKNDKPVKPIIIAIFLLVAFGAEGKALPSSISASYVQALQTADAFLWAWVNRDADVGRRLISRGLSSKLQRENNEEWFRNYMIGLSNPHHHSFEIGSGKEINPELFSFPVTLYEYYTGEPKAFKYNSKIELVREDNLWRVDVLPLTSDNQ
jgi:hypothetical protein